MSGCSAMQELEARPAPVGAGPIRPLLPDDLRQVADSFQRTFRDPRRPTPPGLADYLKALYLDHPWYDPALAARVFVGPGGTVEGFIGVLPLRLTFAGEDLRAAIAGSLMVRDPQANPLIGARLVRSFLSGPQELSITETANPVSVAMWQRAGHQPLLAYSLDWLRVLRPVGFAIAAMSELVRSAAALGPLALIADMAGDRLGRGRFRPAPEDKERCIGADADEEAFSGAVLHLSQRFALRPAWDAAMLRWILSHAAAKERHGTAFRRVVRDRSGRIVGCYLYYGRARGIGWVLQVLAPPDRMGAVVDDLLQHAYGIGCSAVRGRLSPHLAEPLMRRRTILFRRGATIIHARRPELLTAIERGEALVTGLAGEFWPRLIGGRFD